VVGGRTAVCSEVNNYYFRFGHTCFCVTS
jgi:hypothetical protein